MRPDGVDDPTLGFNPKKDRIDKMLLSNVTGGQEIGVQNTIFNDLIRRDTLI
jgi:hypothetical protein